MPRLRKGSNLTIKEQGFIQDLVKGKHIGKAIKNNYDVKSDRNASTLGSKMMRNPRIQYAILDLMDKRGVSDIKLVDRLKTLIFDPKKQVLNKEGDIVEVNDNPTSVRALDIAMKIKGAYAPERHEHIGVSLNIYQDMTDEELDRRLQLITAREAILAQGAGEENGS